MIDKIMGILKEEVQSFLNSKMKNVGSEDKIRLSTITPSPGKAQHEENFVSMSLIRIENDRENMSFSAMPRSAEDSNSVAYYNQPLKLNLYILFAANFNKYTESLKFISYVVSFFQGKHVFTSSNTPNMDLELGKVVLNIYNQTMEEQNQMWGMLGGIYFPSILYKLRLIVIDERQVKTTGRMIKEIDLEMEDT